MKFRSLAALLAGLVLAAFPATVLSQATPDATGTGTTNYITRWTSATTQGNSLLFQSTNGRIGLGTTTPTATFDVANGNAIFRGIGGFTTSGNSGSVFVGDAGHGMTAYRGGGLITHGGTALSAYQAPNAFFLQDSTGFVGIGTTNPRSVLDVNGYVTTRGFYMHDSYDNSCTYVYASYGSLYSYETSCP